MSARERLKNKLLEKQKQKLPTIYEEEKTPSTSLDFDENRHIMHYNLQTKTVTVQKRPMFKMVLHQNRKFDCDMENHIMMNAYRLNKISDMIDEKVNEMYTFDKDKIFSVLDKIYVAVHPLWIDQAIESLTLIENCDNRDLIGARVCKLENHRIFIIDKKVTYTQMMVDYLGLCWIRDFNETYKVKDIGRDIIVSMESWRFFTAICIGIEFFHLFTKDPFLEDYVKEHKTSLDNMIVITKEFGQQFYPTDIEKNQIREYIETIGYWSYYDSFKEEN